MKIRFWGVRGSIPVSLPGMLLRRNIEKALNYALPRDLIDAESVEHFLNTLPHSIVGFYGGNTTCIEVRSNSNDLIIIDAGSGLRGLGDSLLKEDYGKGKGEGHILFTHTHWDHIMGMPFFIPFHIEGNIFHIHAIHDNMEGRLRYQHHTDFFSMPFSQMLSKKYFYQHSEDEIWKIENIQVTHKAMEHPGISYAYRLEEDGKVFVFCTDAEFSMFDQEKKIIDSSIDFFRGADLLVLDAQYDFEESLQKIDWGHSSPLMATDIALQAGVKRLALFHHDPSYSDQKLDQALLRSLEYRRVHQKKLPTSQKLEIFLAQEGLEIEL